MTPSVRVLRTGGGCVSALNALTAYFDESGAHDGCPAAAMAAFLDGISPIDHFPLCDYAVPIERPNSLTLREPAPNGNRRHAGAGSGLCCILIWTLASGRASV